MSERLGRVVCIDETNGENDYCDQQPRNGAEGDRDSKATADWTMRTQRQELEKEVAADEYQSEFPHYSSTSQCQQCDANDYRRRESAQAWPDGEVCAQVKNLSGENAIGEYARKETTDCYGGSES